MAKGASDSQRTKFKLEEKMKTNPKGRNENIVVQKMNDEVLLYDLSANKAISLNVTAALVWEMCDGKRRIFEIAQEISKKLKKSVTDEFVWYAIDQLKKENLLVNSDIIETEFEGLSRREVIRKIGITSMAAFPIVSSIIAPQAASAQSGCPAPIGVCLAPNTNLCPSGCVGSMVTFIGFPTSTDTSCMGTPNAPNTFTCTSMATVPFDSLITSVS